MNELTGVVKNTFYSLVAQFIEFGPRVIACITILLCGYLLARVVSVLVKNILVRVGFDKIGERLSNISFIKQMNAEIKLSSIVSKALYYFIILMFLSASTEVLGITAITTMVMSLINFIPSLIAGAIMLQVGILVADFIKDTVVSLCKSFNVPSAKLIGNIVFIFIIIITFISSLAQIGINTDLLESSFILIIGGIIVAFSLGYGIASKDLLSNIISSFYSRDKYKIGQTIKVGNVKGEVIKLDNISITLRTEESTTVVPLHLLQSSIVEIF